MSECGDIVAEQHPEVTKQQAEDILLRIRNLAQDRAKQKGLNVNDAIREVTKEFTQRDKLQAAQQQREVLLTAQKVDGLLQHVQRAMEKGVTMGEALLAKLEGGRRNFMESRDCVDFSAHDVDNKAAGKLWADMEQAGVAREFAKGHLERQVYQELGEIKHGGETGISKSKEAVKIANIIEPTLKEMNARINRAGGFRGNLPGYIAMQTHDMSAVRAAGKTKEESFQVWKQFTQPKLESSATFQGADPDKFLRAAHASIYSGVHGVLGDGGAGGGIGQDIGRKVSAERVLHFKDADSAYEYNQKFGVRDLKEQVLTTISRDAKSIALMEHLGPRPKETLDRTIRLSQEMARDLPDAAKQADSINVNKIDAAYRTVTGENDIPANPNMARIIGNIKTVAQMSRMGGVALSKIFADKAFLQVAMARRGISNMTTLAAQLTGMAARSVERERMLRLMGVGLDGLRGNALSRYSDFGMVSGPVNKAQKAFFDWNFLNYITDTHKKTAGELLSSDLAESAHLPFDQLSPEKQRMLPLYGIDSPTWDKLRQGVWTEESSGSKFLTSDKVREAHPNMPQNEMDKLTSSLGQYYQDGVNEAVPTPGAAEKRLVTQDTKAGTPLGEAIRLLMLFKSFPITIANKVISRDIYGGGQNTIKGWLMNDHQGKFNIATLVAMTTVGGYLSMSIKDALNGKTPRALMDQDGVNWKALNESAVRGGGLGLMGDLMAKDYERNYTSFLETAAGPVLGQLDTLAQTATKLKEGQNITKEASKMTIDNLPLINLFYIRPILNYYVLWNIEEMMNPGTIHRMELGAEHNKQRFFMPPSKP